MALQSKISGARSVGLVLDARLIGGQLFSTWVLFQPMFFSPPFDKAGCSELQQMAQKKWGWKQERIKWIYDMAAFFIYGNPISNFNHVQSCYKGMGDFSRRSTWCFACCNCVASHCSFGTYQCITSHLWNIIQTFGRTWSSGELGSRFAKSIG